MKYLFLFASFKTGPRKSAYRREGQHDRPKSWFLQLLLSKIQAKKTVRQPILATKKEQTKGIYSGKTNRSGPLHFKYCQPVPLLYTVLPILSRGKITAVFY